MGELEKKGVYQYSQGPDAVYGCQAVYTLEMLVQEEAQKLVLGQLAALFLDHSPPP